MKQAAKILFDEELLLLRQKRAAAGFSRNLQNPPDFLLKHVADDIHLRLQTVKRTFPKAIDLHGRTGTIARQLAILDNITSVHRLELAHFHTPPTDFPVELSQPGHLQLAKNSADLIISVFALHWTNNIESTFSRINKALRPDGLFLAVLPGPDTLKELRDCLAVAESEISGGISPRIDPFISLQSAGSLLQHSGFTLPVIDTDKITVRYDNAIDLMHDLRAMGATNVLTSREKHRFSRKLFQRVEEIYSERYTDPDGRIRATFELVSLSGWAPHPDQPKPLKPGSAEVSLARAISGAGSTES